MAQPNIAFRTERTVFEDSDDEDAPGITQFRHDVTTSADGRLRTRHEFLPTTASPRKATSTRTEPSHLLFDDFRPELDPELANLASGGEAFVQDGFDFDEGHPNEPREARASDRPLSGWLENDLETFLDEFMRHEGPVDDIRRCSCGEGKHADLRCRDCLSDARFCASCVVDFHGELPFHRPERWNGSFFELTTLKALGLRIQLGHNYGESCPGTLARDARPEPRSDDNFCVIDVNGVHEIAVDFCTCSQEQERAIQLLRARLYPATSTRPRSAATFRVMRLFHLVSFEAKSSAYEFYNALARLTNNNGTFQPRVRYREFVRMAREWRLLQMLKRAGRAHESHGARNIPAGACALLCPACPQPGKNLPLDGEWRNASPEERYLYSVFLAIDANFKMKRKQVSSEDVDPGANRGCAFFGEVRDYMAHVHAHWGLEQEKSTCVSHDAVNEPDRESRGTASSGMGTVDCARHNFKRPNAVGDLQKGERYINMDYMLWKSLTLPGYEHLVDIIVSYDIACQWSKNVWIRLARYHPELCNAANVPHRRYVFLIPKFHLPAHIERCNIDFSFDLTPHVGRTDGEAPERGWANVNPLASSTKEMGPGARRDTIDDHFNDWNHKKIVGMDGVLLGKIKTAVEQMVETRVELGELEGALPDELISIWTRAMTEWEADASRPNPFNVTTDIESLQDIRARLKTPSLTSLSELPPQFDTSNDIQGELHAADIVAMGLTLEEQRYAIAADASGLSSHATDLQRAAISERETKLQRKILSWFDMQLLFTPEVAALRARSELAEANGGSTDPARTAPLQRLEFWLPSAVVAAAIPGYRPPTSHAWYEFQLRHGRALQLLEELRRLLLLRTQKFKAKDKHASGVAGHTRAAKAIQNVDARILRVAEEYRRMRSALMHLRAYGGDESWLSVLRDLKREDVRPMPRALFSDPERRKRKRGEGAEEPKEMSWIWRMGIGAVAIGTSSADLLGGAGEEAVIAATNESLRVEWAKARARAKRWAEEVELLQEEMRRVLEFFSWKAAWWRSLEGGRVNDAEQAVAAGLEAYANRQARLQEQLRAKFERSWADVPEYLDMGLQQVQEAAEEATRNRPASISLVPDDENAFSVVTRS
ncbi:CxC2 domain-containing protein [Mycena kentingensis (nom. inval.)]|nr:CxC2 domain-containing protein [Mycena kentingensis (nom. inval.)]